MTTANDSKTVSVPARKGVQVHATIPADLFDKLEDHRWNVRLDMVALVKLALTEYAERNGLLTEAAAPAADKGAAKA